jgi:sigma-B regulation protein RsbU (phosphoserine phosphatase)
MAVRISPDLSEIATHMNEQLCADLPTGRFITVWLGALNRFDNTLTTISGGQAPLLLYRARADEFETLNADTTPFGLFDSGRIEAVTSIILGPGDIYAVISDGIFESKSPVGEEFGAERVQAVLREHREESAAGIVARIREAVDAFTEAAPAADDRTIVLIKRRGDIPD